MSPACHDQNEQESDHCHPKKGSPDYLLWGSLSIAVIAYFYYLLSGTPTAMDSWYTVFTHTVYQLINTMWPGIVIGVVMIALLAKVPRDFVMSVLGTRSGVNGILRATAAGVLLDLCSHGILMVGAKLYERGASIGQVMAFLIASPWNSFSLTLILITLIGLKWTLVFIALSALIAVLTGLLFDLLVSKNILPDNPQYAPVSKDFRFWPEAKKQLQQIQLSTSLLIEMARDGLKESRIVLRWVFFGVILAGLIRAFIDTEQYGTFFGPTLAGLGLSVLAATIIEVCSEGSAPIAADLLTRAKAPGNCFAFLMAGVSTDYTEIMVLKDTTKSWKLALFLPLLTLPQIIIIGWIINLTV